MRKTLRNVITVGALGLAGLLPGKTAEAQGNVNGNVEYIQSEQNDKSFVRANAFYDLPLGARGFSFVELYQNGSGYFGKTILSKNIAKGIGPKLEAVYINDLLSRVGLGVNFSIPNMPKGGFANLGLIPVWVSDEGKRTQAQYVFGLDLPRGFNVNGFGEMNVSAEGGPQWSYGETELVKKFGSVEVGYNMRLRNDGNASPKIENGLVLTLNFGGKK